MKQLWGSERWLTPGLAQCVRFCPLGPDGWSWPGQFVALWLSSPAPPCCPPTAPFTSQACAGPSPGTSSALLTAVLAGDTANPLATAFTLVVLTKFTYAFKSLALVHSFSGKIVICSAQLKKNNNIIIANTPLWHIGWLATCRLVRENSSIQKYREA